MSFVEQGRIRQIESQELNKEKNPLSSQQIAILELAAKGLSNREIAEELKISHDMVKFYFYSGRGFSVFYEGIFVRLNVYSRKEAVVKAADLGLLDPKKLVQEEELKRCELLSEDEVRVLSCLADPSLSPHKITEVQIADKLGDISRWKVRRHLTSIYGKLEIEKKGGSNLSSTRAAVIFLTYKQRQETTSPSHERLRGHQGADGW